MDENGGGIAVSSRSARCDGGGGPLGHPAVYLKIGPEDEIACPYCSRRFVLRKSGAASLGTSLGAPPGAR
ncbi:MAG: zinc-finger domain-containing protein [Rhodospirillales bacterium]